MKIVFITITLLLGTMAGASDTATPGSANTEAFAALNCDEQVPGSLCPAKNSTGACKTIHCDSQVKGDAPDKKTTDGAQ